jgi:hypothetical protein
MMDRFYLIAGELPNTYDRKTRVRTVFEKIQIKLSGSLTILGLAQFGVVGGMVGWRSHPTIPPKLKIKKIP